jgi:hypothetical protein
MGDSSAGIPAAGRMGGLAADAASAADLFATCRIASASPVCEADTSSVVGFTGSGLAVAADGGAGTGTDGCCASSPSPV